MIVIIFAGGEGSRLWPLSTTDYPKHLLPIIEKKSTVILAYERAKLISENVYIVTDSTHAKEVKKQIPKLPDPYLIIEPARRGTANCFIVALNAITKKQDHNEVVVFMPADHFIRDKKNFSYTFKVAEKVSRTSKRILLIGSEPNYPATGFGYILRGPIYDQKNYVFNVRAFKEKPAYALAKTYLKNGNYFWNSSYFVGSIYAFITAMKKNAPKLYASFIKLNSAKTQRELNELYLGFSTVPIDYELIEKVNNLLLLPALFDWLDLGSYIDLQRALDSNEDGNYIMGKKILLEAVENSFIHNSEQKHLAVIGLDNIVVVNTKDGILVARKDLTQQVGKVSKRLKEIDK
jgi:mannose-1-phosphate guanylyltransferase